MGNRKVKHSEPFLEVLRHPIRQLWCCFLILRYHFRKQPISFLSISSIEYSADVLGDGLLHVLFWYVLLRVLLKMILAALPRNARKYRSFSRFETSMIITDEQLDSM